METVRDLDALRGAVAEYRAGGDRVALVPTMGALHAGHIALVEAAKRAGTKVVASIFVNPKQFGPNEDLARYPRREAQDARMLADAGCDLVWMPPVEVMYPDGFATNVSVAGVTEGLDGAARPGHFDGVATVVTKLFNQVRPDTAYFGEKDFQQLRVIQQAVADLDLPVEIRGVPTMREADGLALSSRNRYLSPAERAVAPKLHAVLTQIAAAARNSGPVVGPVAEGRATLEAVGLQVQYLEVCDSRTLAPVERVDGPARVLVAGFLGRTRLIDNVAV